MRANAETTKIEETVARVARLYAAAGPRLGCVLVEANVLLVLADLRGSTNFVLFEPTEADRAAITRLGDTLDALGLRASIMPESRNANGRQCSAVVVESLAGYAYVSRQTKMPWVTQFEAATGWSGWETWARQTHADLKTNYPDESESIIYDRWIGMALGYPDQAIEDACQCVAEGRDWSYLARADIPAIERYRGALPVFSFAPVHASDPGIVETIATWQHVLEEVYASPWLQQLADDPAFQAARQEREHTRAFSSGA